MSSIIRAPRGATLNCKGWHQEAALRCLMNNLDPDVAERPEDLVVYGGAGKAARNWPAFHAIVRELQALENDETLLVQSGKPVAVFRTHEHAPRVLIANSNLVGAWATWDNFNELERRGLMMYGQMTAGSWMTSARRASCRARSRRLRQWPTGISAARSKAASSSPAGWAGWARAPARGGLERCGLSRRRR